MQIKNDSLIFGGFDLDAPATKPSYTFKVSRLVDADFNDIVTPGLYCALGDVQNKHSPWDGWSFLLVFNIDNIYIRQIAFKISDTHISQRTRDTYAWANWTDMHS